MIRGVLLEVVSHNHTWILLSGAALIVLAGSILSLSWLRQKDKRTKGQKIFFMTGACAAARVCDVKRCLMIFVFGNVFDSLKDV